MVTNIKVFEEQDGATKISSQHIQQHLLCNSHHFCLPFLPRAHRWSILSHHRRPQHSESFHCSKKNDGKIQ